MKRLLVLAIAVGVLVGGWFLVRSGFDSVAARPGVDPAGDRGLGEVRVDSAPTLLEGTATDSRLAVPHRPGAVRGVVRPAAMAGGIRGVQLTLEPQGGGVGERTISNEQGEFAFPEVRPGSYQLRTTGDGPFGAFAQGIEVLPGAEAVVDVGLTARFSLLVHVFDATPANADGPQKKNAVPAAHVALFREDTAEPDLLAETDSEGNVHLESIPSGAFVLRIQASGFVDFERAQHFDLTRYESDASLRGRPLAIGLYAHETSLQGLVVGPGGGPIRGALVCLDTRTRAMSGSSGGARRGSLARTTPSMPHAVTDERGVFKLSILSGFPEQSVLVCPGVDGLPLVFRRELSNSEIGATEPLHINVPSAVAIDIHCVHADNSLGRGSVELSDGIVTFDLGADSVLRDVPGIDRWNAIERAPGRLGVWLAPGGYKVLFRSEEVDGAMKAFFVKIAKDNQKRVTLALEDD